MSDARDTAAAPRLATPQHETRAMNDSAYVATKKNAAIAMIVFERSRGEKRERDDAARDQRDDGRRRRR